MIILSLLYQDEVVAEVLDQVVEVLDQVAEAPHVDVVAFVSKLFCFCIFVCYSCFSCSVS